MIKFRNWVYFLFMLSFAILGIVESTVVQKTVTLFDYVPIPALTKYILPVITSAVFIVWSLWILVRLGKIAEAEENSLWDKAKEIRVRIILESPTICTLAALGAIIMLDSMQEHLISWEVAQAIYSYGILWVALVPCIAYALEFLQGINGFPDLGEEKNSYLKSAQTIDGLISAICTLIAFALLIIVGNMSVCSYMYIIYVILIIYRFIRYYHVVTATWTIEPAREKNEIDEKEGIL